MTLGNGSKENDRNFGKDGDLPKGLDDIKVGIENSDDLGLEEFPDIEIDESRAVDQHAADQMDIDDIIIDREDAILEAERVYEHKEGHHIFGHSLDRFGKKKSSQDMRSSRAKAKRAAARGAGPNMDGNKAQAPSASEKPAAGKEQDSAGKGVDQSRMDSTGTSTGKNKIGSTGASKRASKGGSTGGKTGPNKGDSIRQGQADHGSGLYGQAGHGVSTDRLLGDRVSANRTQARRQTEEEKAQAAKQASDKKAAEKLASIRRKEKIKHFAFDFILLAIACFMGSFATVAVMIPNGLTSGGLTGIVRILQHLIPLDFGVIYYISTAIIVLIVFIFLGFNEVKKILVLSFMYPTILMLVEAMNIQLLEQKDILLAAVFCGVFSGICTGIVFERGYVFAGVDAIAKIFCRKLFPEIPLSRMMLVLDAIVITVSALIFGRNIALYALITQVILAKTADMVMFGIQGKVYEIRIITRDQTDPIVDFILNDMHRGVTSDKVLGEYTKERLTQLTLLCSPRESILIKKMVRQIDPNAFLTVRQVDNVWGKGFKKLDEEN